MVLGALDIMMLDYKIIHMMPARKIPQYHYTHNSCNYNNENHLEWLQGLQHGRPAGDQVLHNKAALAALVGALDGLLGAVVLDLLRVVQVPYSALLSDNITDLINIRLPISTHIINCP